MSVDEKELKILVDEFRAKGHFDIIEIIKTAHQRGINIDYSTLGTISRYWYRTGELLLPESIPGFILKFLKDFSPKNILDPWAGTGSLLSPINKFFKPKKALGITTISSNLEIAKLMPEGKGITWEVGEPFDVIDKVKGKFDLIISVPPFGTKRVVPVSNESSLSDNYGNLLILKACERLTDQGIGIFVVTPSFFFRQKENDVRNSLNKFDLFLDAAFLLPPGSFEPITSINGYLIVVRRKKNNKLFVGQVYGNHQQDSVLLKNYQERKEGKIPQQGILVNENEFKGLDTLISAYETAQMMARSGLSECPIKDVSLEINLPKRNPGNEFIEATNVVYLPLIGNSPAVTSIQDFLIKPQNYAQILFDDNKAFAPYVAKFFNSRLGLKVRNSLTSGSVIPKITKASLESGLMYLPPISTQKEASRLNTGIANLSAELNSLQFELLEFPNKAAKIENKLKRFSQGNGLELWMEELPFPMASILWAYVATVDPKDRLDHISHFFEASIQFLAMICLSAIAQDKDYYKLNQRAWNTENPKYKDWYKKASFGGWFSLQSSLAKFVRGLLSKEDTKSRCLSLFGNANEQFIQTLVSKRLLGVFQDANTYRNLWIGHRGRLSEEEAKKRVSIFEDLLSKMREVIGDSFSQVLLLSPKTSEYVDGIFEYKVKAIKGTRPEFRELMVQSIIPLDKKKLYILPELQLTPIEVLPFGKLMSSPVTAQNAFYFYSRFDAEGVRWVSYHFEKEAEVISPDAEMVGMMKELFDGENG